MDALLAKDKEDEAAILREQIRLEAKRATLLAEETTKLFRVKDKQKEVERVQKELRDLNDEVRFVSDKRGDVTTALKMLDLETGVELGTAAVGPTRGSITINEGKLFVGNEAGEMFAFDTQTLTRDWKFSVTSVSSETNETRCKENPHPAGAIRGAPAVYQGNVFFGTLTGFVYAVDEEGNPDGTTDIEWIFETGDAVWASPTIDRTNGRVLVGSYDERVYSFTASPSGEGSRPCHGLIHRASWAFAVGSDGHSKVHSSPATDGERVYFGANNGNVYAIEARTGKYLWAFVTAGNVVSSPAVAGATLVAGSDDHKVYFLNATDGLWLKEHRMDSPVKSSPAVSGQNVFVASFEGTIARLGPPQPTLPDLMLSTFTADREGMRFVVRNVGDGAADASVLRVRVNGATLTDLDVPALQPWQTVELTYAHTFQVGAYDIQAVVDATSRVLERDEGNNDQSRSVEVEPQARDVPALPVALLVGALLLAARRQR